MNILIVHNQYTSKGGEDTVVENEMRLLKNHGHNVDLYTQSNSQINGLFSKIKTAIYSSYSKDIYKYFNTKKISDKYDIIHVHNFFPLITPSIFYAAKNNGIPIVMTLHNYRLICPSGLLMHKDKIYEKSIKYGPYSTIFDKVYRNSFIGTFFLAKMIHDHKKKGTWNNTIDKLIALTNFGKKKFIESGINESQLVVKPNFVHDSNKNQLKKENYALFVGRISKEKGIMVLLEAWKEIDYKLIIIGDGPLKNEVINTNNKNIIFLGQKNKTEVTELMQKASFLVMPSTWYEGLPMVLIESFCAGLPVIASKIGTLEETVENNVTGLHFKTNNVIDLRLKANKLISDKALLHTLSKNARNQYLNNFSASKNYNILIDIYSNVIKEKNSSSHLD